MNRSVSFPAFLATLAALLCGNATAQDLAARPDPSLRQGELPFERSVGIGGTVSGSLGRSATAAGVPWKVTIDVLHAFATAIDLDREVHDGDRFYVRYERTFSLDGAPLDDGRVVWAELRQAGKKAPVALHRFRPFGAAHDSFWLASGQGTDPPLLRLPVSEVAVSSGFGLRVDPMDQPPSTVRTAGAARGHAGKGPMHSTYPPGLVSGPGGGGLAPKAVVNVATPLGLSLGLAPNPATAHGPGTHGPGTHGLHVMAVHEGVDLVAPLGTPILAAGDGVVRGAEPKGRYGNWIEIDHEGDLATVYGHLASFAPGIAAGAHVSRGDVIGYVGVTGRTTGPHVHFEVRFKERPVNPMVYSALKPAELHGADLDRFRKVVARDLAERDGEAQAASAGF